MDCGSPPQVQRFDGLNISVHVMGEERAGIPRFFDACASLPFLCC